MKFIKYYLSFAGIVFFVSASSSQMTVSDFQDYVSSIVEWTENDFETLERNLVAKAAVDECFFGIGDANNVYNPGGIDCEACEESGGQGKVNQAYVWGLTESRAHLWFGTAPNVNCLVSGGYLGTTTPQLSESFVCEFDQSALVPPLPGIIGDWRPPQMFKYQKYTKETVDITPLHPLVNQTIGIRSAGSTDDIVIFGGPDFTEGINLFFYNADDGSFISAINVPEFVNIRKWYNHDEVLYAGVGKPTTGGAVVRYTGNPGSPLEEVGSLDSEGAEIEFHEDRIYVTTWPNFSTIGGGSPLVEDMAETSALGAPGLAGLYRGPIIPPGGYTTGDAPNWDKVWDVSDYEPDPLIAFSYGGGALASYEGELYWGTMHVPFISTALFFATHGVGTTEETIEAVLGTTRAISIFRGTDLATTPQFELLYGQRLLPAYNPGLSEWNLVPNSMGGVAGSYGFSGFGNIFNNYTWTMEVFDGQLFVGTMDYSYLVFGEFLPESGDDLPTDLPFDCEMVLGVGPGACSAIEAGYDILRDNYDPTRYYGADLWRFPSGGSPAIPESFAGVGNHLNYGIRTMLADDFNLYLGTANPMNLAVDCDVEEGERPITGGWELICLGEPLAIPTLSQWGIIALSLLMVIFGVVYRRKYLLTDKLNPRRG